MRTTGPSPIRTGGSRYGDSEYEGGSPGSPYSRAGSLNDEEGDEWLNEAVGSDYDYSNHSDDDSDDQETGSSPKKKNLHPDILFQDEFLYWVVRMIRGPTAGRKLKRTVFKISCIMLICSFPLIVIAYIEDRTFEVGYYFTINKAGAPLQPLMWLSGVPGFFLGVVSMYILKYWASLCTNRLLLTNMMRVYMAVLAAYMFIVTYTVAVLFITFGKIERWTDSLLLARIFPFYVCTVLFIIPLDAGLFFYIMDISYFIDEVANTPGSEITEPDPPPEIMDLTDVTASQLILVVLSMPFLVFIQCFDLCVAVKRAGQRYFAMLHKRRMNQASANLDVTLESNRKGASKSSIFVRIWRTARRRLLSVGKGRGGGRMPASMVAPEEAGHSIGIDTLPAPAAAKGSIQELKLSVKDRELEERLERERKEEEVRLKEERRAADRDEREALEAMRQAKEDERRAREEQKDLEEMREREKIRMAPILDVPLFKDKWSTLPAAGTFSCRLRASPDLPTLTEHMRAQGFHVVFASTPAPTEVELGLCNIRELGTENWFLARFLSSQGTFSAVMKCESAIDAPIHVKKFALAKVLKIDASSVPKSPKHNSKA